MLKKLFIVFTLSTLGIFVGNMSAKEFVLVIDAGHGGHDAGAVGAFSKEKDINLNVALAFGRYVEKNCPDVKVIYTRDKDVFVTLHGRADIANKAHADLFVSVHTNAQPAGYNTAKGLETYTLGMHRAKDNLDVAKRENSVILVEKDYKESYQGFDPNSAESYIIFEFMQDNNMQRSVDMAKFVQKNACKVADRPDKGVKQAGFLVLRETSMPSCLIELGFISTPAEEKYLNAEENIDNLGKGIYNAFIEYKKKYDRNVTVPYKAEEPTVIVPQIVPMVTEKKPAEVPAPKAAKVVKKDRKHTDSIVTPKVIDLGIPKETPVPVVKAGAAPVQRGGSDAPVFKVQIVATDKPFKSGDPHFKGRTDYGQYKENGMTKYTIGETEDYNEILRIKRELQATFADCFIVAFKNGEKIKTADAINEFKRNGR